MRSTPVLALVLAPLAMGCPQLLSDDLHVVDAGGGGSGAVTCGDGVLDANEECDDGNDSDGDGCDASCVVECDGPGLSKNQTDFHCYQHTFGQLAWQDARTACQALGSGWELVAISSEEERDFVDNVVDPSFNIWTGGNDLQTEGQFEWTNGEPWGYTPWTFGGPPPSFLDCVELEERMGPSNDLFAGEDCSMPRSYVCELTPAGS